MFNRLFLSPTLAQLRSRGFLLSRGKLKARGFLCLFCLAVSLAHLLLGFPAMVYAQPDSTQEVYEYVMQWGTTGSDTGQFDAPGGMCIDDSGYIYVCDFYNYRIQKFDRNGLFILMWGRYGSGPGEFLGTYDIAADHYGRIYVSDNWSNRIEKFDSRGNFILQWTDTAAGLDVGPFNQLYIAKATAGPYDSLMVYDTVGNRLRAWGNPFGTQYWLPDGVGVDDSGNVYVSKSPSNIYIIKFDSTGNFLLKWGSDGTGNGQFSTVPTIRTGDGCKVFTPDRPFIIRNYRVQKFSSDSTFVTTWGRQGNGNGEFQSPFSAVVDKEGYVYVSDGVLDRIQKFRKTVVGVGSLHEPLLQEKKSIHIECFPNLMNSFTKIKYLLPNPGVVTINFYNVAGQRLKGFASKTERPGYQVITWDGRDDKGQKVPSGVYLISLENNSDRATAKLTVIR